MGNSQREPLEFSKTLTKSGQQSAMVRQERYGDLHAASAVGWRIEHVGRPRSEVHRVTCPTCAGEDGEHELPPMYDPREDIGR